MSYFYLKLDYYFHADTSGFNDIPIILIKSPEETFIYTELSTLEIKKFISLSYTKRIPINSKNLDAFQKYKNVELKAFLLDESLKSFLEPHLKSGISKINLFYNSYCWRYHTLLSNNGLIRFKKYWSDDNIKWHVLLHGDPPIAHNQFTTLYRDKNQLKNDLSYLLDKKEPLAQDLMREAFSIYQRSPRSSFILSYTALEIGVKKLISNINPHNEWLVFNMPSPSIVKILKEYFPKITKKELSDNTLDEIKKITKIRNDLVHTGVFNLELPRVYLFIDFIRKLLYLFDSLNGENWAKNYHSNDFLK